MIKPWKFSCISFVLLLSFVGWSFLGVTALVVDKNVTFTNNNGFGEASTNEKILIRSLLSEDSDQTYVLGFASPNSNSEFFLSIWLNLPFKQSVEVVWVASRDHPVKENATARFVINGSLTLHDSDGSEVWSTNTDGQGGLGVDMNITSGNLRVFGANNQTLWQSFDHPTNVLLEGATLGAGSKLVSNPSTNNFSEGAYSLTMDPGGMALRISSVDTESQPYWMWGYYDLNDSVSLSKTCQHPAILVFSTGILSMVLNNNIISDKGSPDFCNIIVDQHVILTSTFLNTFPRFLRLDSDGNLRVYVYNGAMNIDYDFFPSSQQCDLPEPCGRYGVCNSATGECSGCPVVSDDSITNSSELFSAVSGGGKGCSLEGGTAFCDSSPNGADVLVEISGVNYFSNKYNPADAKPSTALGCQDLCRTNCSCTAAFFRANESSCYVVTESIRTLQKVADKNNLGFVKVSATAVGKVQDSSNLPLILGLSLAGVFLVLLFVAGFIWNRMKRRKRKSEDDAFLKALPGLPPRFTMKELQVATSGFSHKLGSGGFGTVYEGLLPDGTKVAVKKLESAKQGRKEFRAEVATIGSIHHMNLVRLRGFCADAYENMLVYEFMPNGSLDRWLFSQDQDPRSPKLLSWSVRFKIALGTARGLAYLHEDLRERIIHLDIKPQNILLDEKFVPKVADFGLAKLVDRENDQSLVFTTMRGTPGYLAPEWLVRSGVTEKSDVYSYGMVLLELAAGRKCLDIKIMDSQKRYLPTWALREVEEGRAVDIIDKRLGENFDHEQALRVIHIAFLCIHEDMDMRPTMGTVVRMLEGDLEVPEREHLNVQYADVRHSLYSRYLNTIKSSAVSSSDNDNLEMTLLSNMVISEAR